MKTPRPVNRKGWASYYAQRYNRTLSAQAEHLATWYLILHEAFDSEKT